ncbi:MAG: hypothetical protein HRU34_01015 [Richelia sp.]|nr:hypothetical protein [Richelia sp.]CDN13141.1 hypothetical protein RintRC_7575 [Richelia intracellularis]
MAFALDNQDIPHNCVQQSVIFTRILDALTLTMTSTLRWVFQCFQGIHLLTLDSVNQIVGVA